MIMVNVNLSLVPMAQHSFGYSLVIFFIQVSVFIPLSFAMDLYYSYEVYHDFKWVLSR